MKMIFNQTQNKVISNKERLCKNPLTQALGLMFRRKQNLVMVFKKEKPIQLHNFFVFYPLDVLILNENKEIIEIKENFKPFTLWNPPKEGKYLIELGENNSKNNYSLGDQLVLK